MKHGKKQVSMVHIQGKKQTIETTHMNQELADIVFRLLLMHLRQA